MNEPISCGTTAGYHLHCREKTVPCQPCLDALAVYIRARRIRSGTTRSVPIPLSLIARMLPLPWAGPMLRRQLGGEVCDAITARFRKAGAA